MYQRVLVAVDGSDLSQRAMQQGVDLAHQLGATLIGFVVESLPPLPSTGAQLQSYRQDVAAHEAKADAHARTVLARFAETAAKAGVPFEAQHDRNDDVAAAIVKAAEQHRADMIVMVTHGRGSFGELLFGSHTKKVLATSKKPLLVLH